MLEAFVRTYGDRRYKHTTMIRHKGKVITFAQDESRRIFYAILDLENNEIKSPLDVHYWPENPKELIFPNEIAEVGVGVADQTLMPVVKKGRPTPVKPGTRVREEEKDLFLSTTARLTADAPFQALTDGQHVFLFRQAIGARDPDNVVKQDRDGNAIKDKKGNPVPIVDGTLLVDRFVLSGTELQTKMEVRYQRSRSKTRPESRKDSLGAKDMEERPFFEPTQELRFVRGLTDGRFTALLLPTQIAGVQRWQIFAHNSKTGMIDSYNIERADDGLFNTRGTQPPSPNGHAESALTFDADTLVDLGPGVHLGAAFTQEAWIYPTANDTASSSPLGRGLLTAGGRTHNGAPEIWIYQDRAIRAGFGDGSQWNEIVTRQILTPDTWNHVAVSFDGTYYRVYVNGEERHVADKADVYVRGRKKADPEPLSGKKPADNPVKYIGAKTPAGSSFHGIIDDLRLWDRVRSKKELGSDMNRRLTGLEPGLAGYWRFDEASGSQINDQTNNAHHGVLSGGKWVTSDAPVGEHSGLNRSSFRFSGRTVESGLAALLYYHQEKSATGYDRQEKPLKHNARVMLAAATQATAGGKKEIATLDFGVSITGRLAQTPDNIDLATIDRPSRNGQSVDERLNQIAALQQGVLSLKQEHLNLTEAINALNYANKVITDALSGRAYRTDISETDLAYLNAKVRALRQARREARQKSQEKRRLDNSLRRARAIFYEHIHYGGRRLRLGLGVHSQNELKRYGFNKLISSMWIPEPLEAVTYETRPRTRAVTVKNWKRGTSWVGDAWNDRITNLHIREAPAFARKRSVVHAAAKKATDKVNKCVKELQEDLGKLQILVREKQDDRRETERQITSKETELNTVEAFLNEGFAVSMPLVHTDPMGLSITGALLGFAWSNDTPLLFDSATGKLALYFRGHDDQFFVTYYDTLTQRAVYKLVDERAETSVICVARSTEPDMDRLKIHVGGDPDPRFCTVKIDGPDVRETWKRVPRHPESFAKVLNGLAGERAYIGSGSVETEAGRVERLLIPAGVRRSLEAGATLVAGETRVTVRGPVIKGATAIPVVSAAIHIGAETLSVFFIEYDYALNARTTRIPGNPANGSLLILATPANSHDKVQVDQTLQSGNTLSSRWTAAAAGHTLAFNGAKTLASTASNSPASLKKFSASGDVTLEAWVKPGEIPDNDKAQILQHKSGSSSYSLGLKSQDLNSALRFDGADDQVLIPESWALDLTGVITLEAWIKPEAFDGLRNIVARGPAANPQRSEELFLRIQDGQYQVGSKNAGGEYQASMPIPADDKTGLNWVHLAGVYDGKAWHLYRNGKLEKSQRSSTGAIPVPENWAIGGRGTAGTERLFKGQMDEVRIWKRGRTEAEIRADMNRHMAGNETDLVGCWHFQNQSARDASRYGNDGTLKGNPTNARSPLPGISVFASAGGKFVQTKDVFAGGSWCHLAAVFNQSYGLRFDGSKDTFLDCGSETTLDIGRDLTVEVFLKVDSTILPCGLLSKGKIGDGTDQDVPYALFIDKNKKLVFGFEDKDHRVRFFASSGNAISARAFTRLAVTRRHHVETTPTKNSAGQVTGADVRQWTDIRFYRDGKEIGYHKYEGPDAGSSNGALEIGRAYLAGLQEARFKGVITEARIWNAAQEGENVGGEVKGNESGLVSWWRFEENDGNVAYDSKSTNHAKLKGRVDWVKNPEPGASLLLLYRDGVPVEIEDKRQNDFTSAERQFALGMLANSTKKHPFLGEMEEVRVWKTARTQEQIQDNMFRRLSDEKEDLIAYYTFDAEKDGRLSDHSLRGNDLIVEDGDYVFSTAPIGTDTPQVRSALAGIKTPFNGLIHGRPGVQEYGDMQYDVDGNLIGVLKRCYSFVQDGRWHLITGFKVGNLVTEWIGQVQFAPQLIGYIEGAPPVPSENLTATGYVRGEFTDYQGASSVEVTEAQQTTYTYSASKDQGFDMTVDGKLGWIIGTEVSVGFAMYVKAVEVENVLGLHFNFEQSLSWLESAETKTGRTTTKTSKMELRGLVENVDAIAYPYPKIGRRFVPDNVGLALVQSETADVFALRLQHNHALVSFQMRPNPDIPKDWNILTFPLNRQYSKQGTLDGKIGLDPDPDYPNALTYSPDKSYFKPIEAYALKSRLEREQEAIRTFYEQYRAGKLGRRQQGVHFGEQDLAAGRMLDKLPRVEKRNLVNTYVWTADGGLFAETQETQDVQLETVGGSYAFKGLAGVYTDLFFTIGGTGFKFELDAMFGGHLNLSVTKSEESETSFGLNVELGNVEGDIYLRDEQGQLVMDRSDPRNPKPMKWPGKVDAYRFMTFYLEPKPDHFDLFFDKVMDPIWLEQSDEPNAVALRQARQVDKKPPCWRIMHRVTFVSRILPPLSETAAPPLEKTMKSLNIDSNYELIKLLEPFVANKLSNFAEFAQAVRETLKTYHPELLAHSEAIIQYMALYYGISEEMLRLGDGQVDDTLPGFGAPLMPAVDAGPEYHSIRVGDELDLEGSLENSPQPLENLLISWSQISGPQSVVFSDPNSLTTIAEFPERGLYRLRLTVNDGLLAVSDELEVVVSREPEIAAGSDLDVLPRESAELLGALIDDGRGDPNRGEIQIRWSKVSGPGDVQFADPRSLRTTATFSESGRYLLRLTVDNGSFETSDDVMVAVAARVTKGLQALYVFQEGEGTEVRDVSAAGPPLDLVIPEEAKAKWVTGGLEIQEPTTLSTSNSTKRIAQAAKSSNEMTIEAWVKPAAERQPGLARIVTYSSGPASRNFVLGQRGNAFYAALRTETTNPTAGDKALAAGTVKPNMLTHVVCTRDASGSTRLYVDGQAVGERQIAGGFSNWDESFALALGNEVDNGSNHDRAWSGELHLIAIYGRALTPAEVQQNFNFGANTNLAPLVSAGSDQMINLPDKAQLRGAIVDDRLRTDQIKTRWTQASGPADVLFEDAASLATTVTFETSGRYVLRLTASEDQLSASDEVIVIANQAPVIDAGPEQWVSLPDSARLQGVVISDGLGDPSLPSNLQIEWSQLDGPAPASLSDPRSLDTEVRFSKYGVYKFQLSVHNGYLRPSVAEVTLFVNQKPEIGVSTDPIVTLPNAAALRGEEIDLGLADPDGTVTRTWAKESGPGEVTFADAHALNTEASFSRSGVYVLKFKVEIGDDTGQVHLASESRITIVANQEPVVDAGPDLEVELTGAVELDGTVSDDGLPDPPGVVETKWRQVSGPGESTFEDATATYTRARFSEPGTYVLELTAKDYAGATAVSDEISIVVKPPPRVREGLQVLYTFEDGSGDLVRDVSGVGTPVDLKLEKLTDETEAMTWLQKGLSIRAPLILKATAPATSLLEALKASNEVTLEAWVKRARTIDENQSPGRIVTLSADTRQRNVTLGQSVNDRYQVRLRTTKTDGNGIHFEGSRRLARAEVEAVSELCHLVYTRDAAGKTNFYLNGSDPAAEDRPVVDGDFSNWGDERDTPPYELALANELTGNRPWLGEFHLIAIYDRALSEEQVRQNFMAGVGVGV